MHLCLHVYVGGYRNEFAYLSVFLVRHEHVHIVKTNSVPGTIRTTSLLLGTAYVEENQRLNLRLQGSELPTTSRALRGPEKQFKALKLVSGPFYYYCI